MKLDTATDVLEWSYEATMRFSESAGWDGQSYRPEYDDDDTATAERLALGQRVLETVEALAQMNEPGFRNILAEAAQKEGK